MAILSSPVAYPPSSSPVVPLETRKRPLPNESPHRAKKRLSEHEWSKIAEARHSDNASANAENTNTRTFKAQIHGSQSIPTLARSCSEAVVAPTPHLGKSIFRGNRHPKAVSETRLSPTKATNLPTAIEAQCSVTTQPPDIGENQCFEELYSPDHRLFRLRTTSGSVYSVRHKAMQTPVSYEQSIARRSVAEAGKAQKSYYGIEIHDLLDRAAKESQDQDSHVEKSGLVRPTTEQTAQMKVGSKGRIMLWTEKYRARRFTDLVGDERTHRTVLRWLKGWDPIVFPGASKTKPRLRSSEEPLEERAHRKLMLLTGPPGLGKTTLAHICARQAGYEVVEINASDERSKDIVKGRIRDIVGTENVKGVNTKGVTGTVRKAGRPVCLIVDEVDGVVGSSGSGEGGFIKALMDLVNLDSKNTSCLGNSSGNSSYKKPKKGDHFRLLRPMILICNDVYHPSLRPLRSSSMAEIIHIRRPPLDKVVNRLKFVFEKEGVACDGDGVRRLCEASWGITNRRESRTNSSNTGEGDIRSILVVGEWVASKLRVTEALSAIQSAKLTRSWVEKNMLENLAYGGGGARGIGRGGAREAVERVFLEGAGFPRTETPIWTGIDAKGSLGDAAGVSEAGKLKTFNRLQEIIDTSGDTDRIINDCFAAYPLQPFQDDTYLSKPNAAYEWLYFHDCVSSKVHSGQDWELAGYLSQSALGLHDLFASPVKHLVGDHKGSAEDVEENTIPFSGPRADYEASETLKQNRAILQGMQPSLSIPLFRSFRSPETVSTDLVPHVIRMLTPNVKPIVVGGSGEQKGVVSVRKDTERRMLDRAVSIMGEMGVTFERTRIEGGTSGYVYRMEP